MRHFAVSVMALLLLVAGAYGQGGSILFGDFEVHDIPEGTEAPATFQILLLNRGLMVVGRETLGPRGRYRFSDLRNGEYQLVIQLEDRELFRMRYHLQEVRPTEVRKDIHLQWKDTFESAPASGDQLLYAHNKSSQSSLDKARRQAQQGKLKESVNTLERLLRADSNDFEAWTELGTAHFHAGRLDKAQSSYEKAVELRPDFTAALVNLAKVHFSQKAFGAAAEFFRQALAAEPDLAESHFLLAETYLQLKKGSLAVEHFEEALRIDPDNMADAHLRMATLYRAAGWPMGAAVQYRDFLEKKPDYQGREQLERYIAEHLKDPS